jgi:hypothetical protein
VPDGGALRLDLGRRGRQRRVPRQPCPGLDGLAASRRIHRLALDEAESEAFGLPGDVGAVIGRVLPQLVIEVEDHQADPKQAAQPVKPVQEADRVGPAGASHQHGLAGKEHLEATRGRGDPFEDPGNGRRPASS